MGPAKSQTINLIEPLYGDPLSGLKCIPSSDILLSVIILQCPMPLRERDFLLERRRKGRVVKNDSTCNSGKNSHIIYPLSF